MLPEGRKQRQFYLGIDFIRKGTKLPKLQIWQEQLLDAYPNLGELALESAGNFNLLPKGATSLRIHSVGGWGAITMGKNVTMTAFELFGMDVKANPKYGSEKKGQPTTFYSVLAHEPIKLNAELKHVNVVLSPDGNVFKHSDPLSGMEKGGVFVIQSHEDPAEVWASLPEEARRTIREKEVKVYALDAFGIASAEASDPELRYRMQGVAFMGAFFRCAPLAQQEGMDEEGLFEGITAQIEGKFGKLGQHVVDDNMRVIRRGFDEVKEVPTDLDVAGEGAHEAPGSHLPTLLDSPDAQMGIANQGRFFEQVCSLCAMGQDGISDPYAALSAIPAATSTVRDMTDIRFEVPDFVAEKCTGCSHAKHLSRESRKILKGVPFTTFGDVASAAYANVVEKLGWDADRRAQLDEQWARVFPTLAEFPLAKTAPFYELPESKQKGDGGMLAITINPEACKGCNICVDVCPEQALITVQQDDEIVDRLRRNWKFWERLPDTDDKYINVRDIDEGIGVLSSLLLKKDNYRSMAGGDGACMGCGEKTAVHLVTSTVEALMQPRVEKLLKRVDELVASLDQQERELLASDADLAKAAAEPGEGVELKLTPKNKEKLQLLQKTKEELEHLTWLYVQGPSGKGRVSLGITNSTGCSSVWGSTYPYNPYPFPWVNHLFQDAPSVAIGVFEGHMRKMADHFISIRRAEQLVAGTYDAEAFQQLQVEFNWERFTDDEFHLCPPILSIGGDGAMMDIGFQNLSRLMASGKPIRVMVLDTQVYSNTGGQACTSGFTGQVADMSAWGKAQHGKSEVRKELAFIAMAHRGVFVHQSSQASASHLIQGVIKGLNVRRPSLFIVYTPCPVEHGLADDWAPNAAKLALEARAFPFLSYDPDGGPDIADCRSLDGNPAVDDTWPTYELEYVDEEGNEAKMELPLTSADWAATEVRFRKNFAPAKPEEVDDMVLFHEFVAMSEEERIGKLPFIWTKNPDRTLKRLRVSNEMVRLAEDRLMFWHQLKEMAGFDVPESVHDSVRYELEAEYEAKLKALAEEYEAKLANLKATYPRAIARRMAEGLLKLGNGQMTVSDLLTRAASTTGLEPIGPVTAVDLGNGGVAPAAPVAEAAAPAAVAEAPAPGPAVAVAEEEEDESLAMEPWIETLRCTSCNECTNLNPRLFAYDDNKQAYIKDVHAGTFAQIVQGAERCPAGIIHPGDPVNPRERDLEKWIKRAEPFN
jgi:pyruvate-ferredoxin/flavodoxin oxidoreductase